jgi:hypothetical protein
MKKISKILYPFTLILLILTLPGCEKLSDEELLTSHTWKWDKMTTSSSDTDVQNFVAVFSALLTNATFEFRDDGTYKLTALNNSDEGTWEMSDDGNTFTMDTDVMTVVKLTKTEFVIEGEEVDDTYGTYSVTMYLKK